MGRKEREATQEYDSGDDDDTVWYLTSRWDDGWNADAYHEDEDCHLLQTRAPEELSRGEAKKRGMKPCGFCVIPDAPTERDGVHYRCTECGREKWMTVGRHRQADGEIVCIDQLCDGTLRPVNY